MSTKLRERTRTDETSTSESGPMAHIVKDKGKVTEAYVMGMPLEALCGKVWVPSKDPKNLPVCQACVDEYQRRRKTGEF